MAGRVLGHVDVPARVHGCERGARIGYVIFRFEDIEVDLERFELRRGGTHVHLEPQVFDVLVYLVQHRDRVVTKEELLDNVWGDRFVSESALTSRLKAARKAVGDSGKEQRLITTVHGRGYRFVATVLAETPAERPAPPVDANAEATEPSAPLFAPRLCRGDSTGSSAASTTSNDFAPPWPTAGS